MTSENSHQSLEESYSFNRHALAYIQHAAEHGLYEIRGLGAKRSLPTFDDLVFLTASLSRYPLEGYRERCLTKTVLGTRHAKKPIELDVPITIAGMSFGALSAHSKEAIGRAATAVGTSTTTGDGGMTPEERQASKTLVYQCLPSRYGFNPDDLRQADAIELVIGQGAKPGGGGMLLGQKISPRVAKMRTLPPGIDQRSACRHPDWTGPDDLAIKILELREITDWQVPIYVKMGASRVRNDVKLAVKSGADVVVIDGMQGGTAATQQVFIEHAGIPTLAALRQADAIELVIGQGAKPGGGGMLLGQKISPRVAEMRTLPPGIDQRSACRHPDWTGPDDLAIKILELREITDWQMPIYVKMGASRVRNDVKLAVKSGADVVVIDGMQGGTAATQQVFIEHAGIPTLPALRQAVEALEEMNMVGEVQLIISGGIRTGADVAKALAMGADAVALGQGVLMALGCNADYYVQDNRRIDATGDYHRLGTAPGFCHHCHTGQCPVGITTQDPLLEQRLTPKDGARRLRNYLNVLTLELTTLARACGKSNVHHLEREDLVALTVEAAAMAKLPLAGTDWIPGSGR